MNIYIRYYGYDYFQAIINEAIPDKEGKIMIAGCGINEDII